MIKLEKLLDLIEDEQEFELYKGNRIGVFIKNDIALDNYLDDEVNGIEVGKDRFIICLD